MAKKKNNKWFIPLRGSYLPNSWQGWLLYVPFLAYLIWAVWAGFENTGTNSAAVLFILPNWIAAVVVMTWIARRTS
ncbi:MAG TPA: hypothetical protein VFW52_01070 [Candidatus Saccharimonadales bacterium]|nr:hypothetical protein [Candidatus Saccharimonadales bacterium]